MLTVAYCPTLYSSGGAVVSVDISTGAWSVVGKFEWPKGVFTGCLIEEDPTIYFDTSSSLLYLDVIDDFGAVIVLDVASAKVSTLVNSKDAFFTGFLNFAVDQSGVLLGFSGTATQNGYCNDGCIQVGDFFLSSGKYTSLANIPFKAIMDDSHFLDSSKNVVYVQASYDLRAKSCGPTQSSLCMLMIDSQTGALNGSIFTNFTVYKYGSSVQSNGNLLSFIEGFSHLCQHPYDDYLFAQVNLATATATPIACIPKNVTIDMDEWISSFSLDGAWMATSSGNAEGDDPQVLVFSTQSGALVLNSTLTGLSKALGADLGLFDVWSADFAED